MFITTYLGWPYVPFFPDTSWPGFLYCQKYLEFDFVCRLIGVWNRFLMFSKCSRGTLNQSNIEILARIRIRDPYPGQMARMVTLYIQYLLILSQSDPCTLRYEFPCVHTVWWPFWKLSENFHQKRSPLNVHFRSLSLYFVTYCNIKRLMIRLGCLK